MGIFLNQAYYDYLHIYIGSLLLIFYIEGLLQLGNSKTSSTDDGSVVTSTTNKAIIGINKE